MKTKPTTRAAAKRPVQGHGYTGTWVHGYTGTRVHGYMGTAGFSRRNTIDFINFCKLKTLIKKYLWVNG